MNTLYQTTNPQAGEVTYPLYDDGEETTLTNVDQTDLMEAPSASSPKATAYIPFSDALMDLPLMTMKKASHAMALFRFIMQAAKVETEVELNDSRTITLERGQYFFRPKDIAPEFKWTRKELGAFLKDMQQQGYLMGKAIMLKKRIHGFMVTITDFDEIVLPIHDQDALEEKLPYTPIAREFFDQEIFQFERYTYADAFLFLIVNAQSGFFTLKKKGYKDVKLCRGQSFQTVTRLSSIWKWDPKAARAFVEYLADKEVVKLKSVIDSKTKQKLGNIITITDYDRYILTSDAITAVLGDSMGLEGAFDTPDAEIIEIQPHMAPKVQNEPKFPTNKYNESKKDNEINKKKKEEQSRPVGDAPTGSSFSPDDHSLIESSPAVKQTMMSDEEVSEVSDMLRETYEDAMEKHFIFMPDLHQSQKRYVAKFDAVKNALNYCKPKDLEHVVWRYFKKHDRAGVDSKFCYGLTRILDDHVEQIKNAEKEKRRKAEKKSCDLFWSKNIDTIIPGCLKGDAESVKRLNRGIKMMEPEFIPEFVQYLNETYPGFSMEIVALMDDTESIRRVFYALSEIRSVTEDQMYQIFALSKSVRAGIPENMTKDEFTESIFKQALKVAGKNKISNWERFAIKCRTFFIAERWNQLLSVLGDNKLTSILKKTVAECPEFHKEDKE